MSQTVLVLGGTSAIAVAYCRLLATRGDRFILVGRHPSRLEAVKADLEARGAEKVATVVHDLETTEACDVHFETFCRQLGIPDQVLLAYGVLGDQIKAENDSADIRRIMSVNFTSAAIWMQVAATHLPRDKIRQIIAIGSVAGDRGRASNYIYGAAKAGLAAFAEGLAHRLHLTPLKVLLIKPGLVDSPMTAHLDRSGPLWAPPERVANCIDKAVQANRSTVVYTPRFWQAVMMAVRFLPRSIFYRTKL